MLVWIIILAVCLGLSVFCNIQLWTVAKELKYEIIHIAETLGTEYEYGKFGSNNDINANA